MLKSFKHAKSEPLDGTVVREHLLARALNHCAVEGISLSTLSRRALNNGKFFDNLVNGRDFTVGTFDRLIQYMDAEEGKSQ